MARKKIKAHKLESKIKVRLDKRTIIYLKDITKLEFWLQKYPNAEVIN